MMDAARWWHPQDDMMVDLFPQQNQRFLSQRSTGIRRPRRDILNGQKRTFSTDKCVEMDSTTLAQNDGTVLYVFCQLPFISFVNDDLRDIWQFDSLLLSKKC